MVTILEKFIQFAVSFGELDISPVTVAILLAISVFTFIAVGLSSFQLVQSAIKDEDVE